ncbi:SLAC1 homologue 1 [Actinidia rufa]|uniref:SLAC1 homologue 1 n=1 Tax=Actinidia rufa TaxID=165716 RepID=A0A7J0EZ78_9ERIC|nr:SLAC1 homologue 1 [Actinidia rufa]
MEDEITPHPIKITINQDPDQNDKHCSSILTRLHAGYFRITLSLGAQALLWKTLVEHTHESLALQRVLRTLPSTVILLLWWLSLFTQLTLSLLYLLRCVRHFRMVKAEFSHYVGVNYLFAPWISWLLLLQSAPSVVPKIISYRIIWVFILPVVVLDVKIYGQWFTTEKRLLSIFANPTSQISVIGNLAGAWAAAEMGWRESAVCMFTLGATHYLVVLITLYQRLSGSCRIPARLRPVYFLFVAAPSMGSLAWNSISGSFDTSCKMLFFFSLFLFTSLFIVNKECTTIVAWWAYSFPVSFLALASAEYAQQVKGVVAPGLMLVLSVLSILVFLCLMMFTAFNTNLLFRENDPNFNKSLGNTIH